LKIDSRKNVNIRNFTAESGVIITREILEYKVACRAGNYVSPIFCTIVYIKA